MLRLVNIKINGNFIEADYIPGDSEIGETGHVKVGIKDNTKEGDIIGDSDGTYRWHAYIALKDIYKEMIEGEELPKTRLVMWY